jgi:SET domain-containing protein
MHSSGGAPPFRVRRSKIHGTGVFATRHIPQGTRIVEYLGERVSHAEADRRYAGKADDDNHTFLFTVDARTVIDAGVGGNEARYINHSCGPNCETVAAHGRIFIEAIADIAPGEELAYDYMIERDFDDPPNIDTVFGCRCGADGCRGTMLLPRTRTRPPARRAPRGRVQHATRQRA